MNLAFRQQNTCIKQSRGLSKMFEFEFPFTVDYEFTDRQLDALQIRPSAGVGLGRENILWGFEPRTSQAESMATAGLNSLIMMFACGWVLHNSKSFCLKALHTTAWDESKWISYICRKRYCRNCFF